MFQKLTNQIMVHMIIHIKASNVISKDAPCVSYDTKYETMYYNQYHREYYNNPVSMYDDTYDINYSNEYDNSIVRMTTSIIII